MSWRSTVLAVCVLAIGCQDPGGSTAGAKADGPGTSGKKYRIAVIPKGTTHEFWKSVHAGAEQAAQELGNVEILWKGSHLENDREGQISVVQDFITSQVDGIVLAPLDSQALVRYVQEAKEEGIPTVIFDSALDEGAAIVSYVATDNYHGGELAARRLAAVLGGKGNVILLRYNQGSESTHQREQGFLDAIEKDFPEMKVISSNVYIGTTPEESLTMSTQVLVKHRDEVDGVFAVCEPNSTGLLGALQNEGLAGKVKAVGFDPSPRLVDALRTRELEGIVLQDPVKMGYLAVKTMVAHLNGEQVKKRIPTGEYVATPENLLDPEMKTLVAPIQFGESSE